MTTPISHMELSKDQNRALDHMLEYFNDSNRSQYLTLGGYAGTGKTTILSVLRKRIFEATPTKKIAFITFTGKASQVMRDKLVEHSTVLPRDFVGTIHSLVYKTIEDVDGAIIGWELREPSDVRYDLLIVDEASMVDQTIWVDLLSFGIPIIAVGDHDQLPPINGDFNLMKNPMLKLEKIHRQAEQNPIIKLSILAREQGSIPPGRYGLGVEKYCPEEAGTVIEELPNSYNEDTMSLCGYNTTRVRLNKAIRYSLGYESDEPSPGDRVICLRNNRKKGIFNGMLGTVQSIHPHTRVGDQEFYKAVIDMASGDAMQFEGIISKDQFLSPKTLNNFNVERRVRTADLFDFGYAVTVHKAQGSQSRKVVLFEERFAKMDDDMWRRWLYTAVTRSQEELYIFGS